MSKFYDVAKEGVYSSIADKIGLQQVIDMKDMRVNFYEVVQIRGTANQAKKNNEYVPLKSDIIFIVNDNRVVLLMLIGDGEHTISELYYRSKWYRRLMYKMMKSFKRKEKLFHR